MTDLDLASGVLGLLAAGSALGAVLVRGVVETFLLLAVTLLAVAGWLLVLGAGLPALAMTALSLVVMAAALGAAARARPRPTAARIGPVRRGAAVAAGLLAGASVLLALLPVARPQPLRPASDAVVLSTVPDAATWLLAVLGLLLAGSLAGLAGLARRGQGRRKHEELS